MKIDPEPPRPMIRPRVDKSRSRGRPPKSVDPILPFKDETSRSRGRSVKKEEVKDEKEDVKMEVKPEVRGRSRSRGRPPKAEKTQLAIKDEEKPEVKKRPKSVSKVETKDKKIKFEPQLTIKDEMKPEVKQRSRSESKGATEDKKIKIEPVTQARARSEGRVKAEVTKLNSNVTNNYWKAQTANEIRSQLALRGIARTVFANMKKDGLVEFIINTITESKKKM